MTRTLCLLLLGLAAALPGAAGAQPAAAIAAVQALPAEAAGFRRNGAPTDFDTQPGSAGRGLGAGQRYTPADGTRSVATIFLYDLGQARAPEGAASPEVRQQLRSAVSDVEARLRSGALRSLDPGGSLALNGTNGQPRILCEMGRAVQQDGAPTGEAVCLTIHQGRFAKLRYTSWTVLDPAAAGLATAALMAALLEAPAPALGGSRKGS
jgi:hypothetical protein